MSNAPSKPVSFSRPKVGYFSNRPRKFVLYNLSKVMLSVNFLKVLLYLLMRISLLMGHFSVRITVAFSLFLTCYTRIDWQLQALTWTVETLTIEVRTFTETSVNADDLVPYPVFGIGTRLRTG